MLQKTENAERTVKRTLERPLENITQERRTHVGVQPRPLNLLFFISSHVFVERNIVAIFGSHQSG